MTGMRPGRVEVYRDTEGGWRWRQHAPNGIIVAAGGEGYGRLRDVAHALELAFPGYRLLDQDGNLTGPQWFMYGLETTCPEAYLAVPEDLVLGMGMRGVRIPVSVPDGYSLASRYRR